MVEEVLGSGMSFRMGVEDTASTTEKIKSILISDRQDLEVTVDMLTSWIDLNWINQSGEEARQRIKRPWALKCQETRGGR